MRAHYVWTNLSSNSALFSQSQDIDIPISYLGAAILSPSGTSIPQESGSLRSFSSPWNGLSSILASATLGRNPDPTDPLAWYPMDPSGNTKTAARWYLLPLALLALGLVYSKSHL